jgi:hypothetical protein
MKDASIVPIYRLYVASIAQDAEDVRLSSIGRRRTPNSSTLQKQIRHIPTFNEELLGSGSGHQKVSEL